MKHVLFLIAISIVQIFISVGHAETPQFSPKHDWKKQQLPYAIELMQHFQNIESSLPELTPAAKEWLLNEKREYKTHKNYMRFLEVKKNDIYKIDMIKSHSRSIIDELQFLITTKGMADKKLGNTTWLNVVNFLLDDAFWGYMYDFTVKGKINKILTDDYDNLSTYVIYSEFAVFLNNGVYPAQQIITALSK